MKSAILLLVEKKLTTGKGNKHGGMRRLGKDF
jgi:hypothetical protein